jgi:TPP-dependent trihydroxycyclohexane-1,2-dione (THcHDO) dehydratase
MATFDFQTLFDQLKKEVSNLAVSSVQQFKKEAEADGQNLLESLKQNLQTWTLELATGEISKEDFEFLVMGQKELIEMNILKQKGMALIDLDKLKISLINQLIKTTLSVI